MDDTFRMDSDYYRFMTLAAFNKPELFGDNYMNVHLDLVFRYFRAISFRLLVYGLYVLIAWAHGTFREYTSAQAEKLTYIAYCVLPDRMDFIVLESTNVLEKVSEYNKYLLSELPVKNKEVLRSLSDYRNVFLP
jgi:hypothetical protein